MVCPLEMCVPWHERASRLLSPSCCNWNWLGGPWKMGACHHHILHESLRSVEEQGLPQTPADITDWLLFPRRTFPRGWKGAEKPLLERPEFFLSSFSALSKLYNFLGATFFKVSHSYNFANILKSRVRACVCFKGIPRERRVE